MNSVPLRVNFLGLLLGIIITSAGAGFYSGQGIEKISLGKQRISESQTAQQRQPVKRTISDTLDLDKVVIQRVATIGFSELYDLMESASPTLRAEWLRQIQKMPDGLERTTALTTYYKVLIQLDPAAAIESLIHPDRRADRLLAIPLMTGAALPSTLGDVVRALLKVPRDDVWRGHGPDYLGDAIYQWSWSDPVAVSLFLEEHKGEDISHYTDELMSNWGVLDPGAARLWLDRFDPEHKMRDGWTQLLGGWFQNDSSSAIDYAVVHATDPGLEDALGNLTEKLFDKSTDEATAFVNRLPNDDARSKALNSFSSHVAGISAKPSPNNGYPADVVARWMVTFPDKAWAEHIGSVLFDWEDNDTDGMLAWMNQLPTRAHDVVAAQCCRARYNGELENELEIHLTIAMGISDQSLRDDAIRNVLEYGVSDLSRVEAEHRIKQASLPPAARTYVLKLLPDK